MHALRPPLVHKRKLQLVALAALALFRVTAKAATPASGTISVANPQLTYTGGPFYYPNVTDSSTGVTCDAVNPCDQFALTVNLPADYATTHPYDTLRFEVGWDDPTHVQDLDVYLLDSKGSYAAMITDTANPEVINIPAGSGLRTYTLIVSPSLTTAQPFTTMISLVSAQTAPPPPPPKGIVPRYGNYSPPAGMGENSGEPSIGYNLSSHRAMFIAGLQTLRATFPENLAPQGSIPEACDAQWDDVSTVVTKTRTLDPILFTDQRTGRTFVSQLNSLTQTSPAGVLIGLNSLFAFTDTDGQGGNTGWTPGQINPPDGSYDHQTVGAGPYPSPIPAGINPVYPDAVYYCSQAGVTAFCSRSDDGGLNFGRSTPIYNFATDGCGGIHGHVKVAPDGTVYVPNRGCSGRQAITVSTDAGTTWTVRRIPTSSPPPGILDPSLGIASDGTLYFAYVGSDGHPHAAVSKDKGMTWSKDYDLGAQVGIQNSVFIETVAGDPDRAAVGFVGTTTGGDHQASSFKGTWYLFIAHTYDGGNGWVTINATPNDPVQREAAIWNQGGNNPNRNLLDFNEVTIDERGRVLYGYADGCVGDCASGGTNSFTAKATIARQWGGKGLFASFDPVEPHAPARACLSGRRDDMASYLRWRTPDTGGADITAYKILRGTSAGSEVQVGQTGGKNSFTDRAITPAVSQYTYKIVAVNAQGDGLASNIITLPVTARVEPTGACALPGVQIITDPAGNATDGQAAHDITSVSMAEPQALYPGKIVFTMKVVNLSTVPPGSRWAVRFSAPTPPPATATGPSEDYFVSMVSSDGVAPTFTWGTTGSPNPQIPARVFTTFGNLEPGSNYTADGTITMIFDKSKAGNPQPGQTLFNMYGSVRLTAPSAVPSAGGTNETIFNATGVGSYTLRAANLCLPNHAPLAVLKATPQGGPKPLTVRFDGSASSDPDPIDTIASYTFNFGDGTDDVVQSSPYISYTFTSAGEYDTKLVVTDSRGKLSSNTAHQYIEVHPTSPSTTALASSLNPSAYANTVTFTATVTSPDGTPTGTVTFKDGNTVLGTGTLDAAGKATFSTASLSIGSHSITGVYGGDGAFQGSTSAALTQTVTQRATATSVSCSPSSAPVDGSTNCTAKVADASGSGASMPAGTATFSSSGSGAFGSTSCTLDATGACSVTYTPYAVGTGTHSIGASYGGDSVHQTSSGSVPLTVTPAPAGQAQGAGQINVPGGSAYFGFQVQRDTTGGDPSGDLRYYNGARSLYVQSTAIRHFNISGATVTFSGDCTKGNNVACTFSVTAQSNGGAGKDTFSIAVSGEPVESGTLVRGGIQVQ
jgi:hypothetical protein